MTRNKLDTDFICFGSSYPCIHRPFVISNMKPKPESPSYKKKSKREPDSGMAILNTSIYSGHSKTNPRGLLGWNRLFLEAIRAADNNNLRPLHYTTAKAISIEERP